MGPEATVLLMSRLIAGTDAQDDCDHVPLIVDSNTQVPSRIRALIDGDGEDPGPTLVTMARKLESYGADALIMPCNTAHNYADVIGNAVGIPFIDMLAETAATLSGMAGKPRLVGVLASPAVRLTGVLDRALAPRGLKAVYPDDDAATLSIIRAVKADGPSTDAARRLSDVARGLEHAGIDVLLIGCTEFSLLADRIEAQAPIVDTLDVLVQSALAFALPAAPSRNRAIG